MPLDIEYPAQDLPQLIIDGCGIPEIVTDQETSPIRPIGASSSVFHKKLTSGYEWQRELFRTSL